MLINIRPENRIKRVLFSRINFGIVLCVIILVSGAAAYFTKKKYERTIAEIEKPPAVVKISLPPKPLPVVEEKEKEPWKFVPGPVSMEDVKKKGCVADGFLNDYGDDRKEMIKLINRSECVYLHRALETWLRNPDFDEALEIMEKVEKRPIVYGMFLAEAVRTNRKYDDPLGGKEFSFKEMCREGTEGKWGADTCVPSIQSVEYRRYLKAITRRAMDMGIQSFLFGQVVLQDSRPNALDNEMKKVIADMRAYAKSKGIEIIVGGQTDSITDEKYLRMFDYVEGGLGIGSDGRIEEGPCWSRMGECWALLWHKRYSSKANHVLLHLDWSGLAWDDMGIFTRMDHERRIERLRYFYNFFTRQDMGFLMPFLAVANRDEDVCRGPSKQFYSPSKKYGCKDEDDIREIMRGS